MVEEGVEIVVWGVFGGFQCYCVVVVQFGVGEIVDVFVDYGDYGVGWCVVVVELQCFG